MNANPSKPEYGRHAGAIQGALAAFLVLAGVILAGAASARTLRVVALGDSLTAGYMLPQPAAFPVVLEKALRKDGIAVTISNAGVSGDTATAGLERLDWSVEDGTDAVIVELGANDMMRGIDPAITRKALETIITRLQARKIRVMLAGMLASPSMGKDFGERFNAIYPELARQYGVPLYPFFLDGIAGDPKLNLPDGMHPTPQGVDVIVAHILPDVKAFLATIDQKAGG